MDTQETIYCRECEMTKPVTEYYVAGQLISGAPRYVSFCKPCTNERQRQRRLGEDVTDYRRLSTETLEVIFCRTCHVLRPRSDYVIWKKGRQEGQVKFPCKPCKNTKRRNVWAANKEASRIKERSRDRTPQRLARYGLTRETYNELLATQGGICAGGCGTVFAETDRRVCVDHCHKTSVVRGILCHNCNVILGLAKDDSAVLHSLAEYLEGQKQPNGEPHDRA